MGFAEIARNLDAERQEVVPTILVGTRNEGVYLVPTETVGTQVFPVSGREFLAYQPGTRGTKP